MNSFWNGTLSPSFVKSGCSHGAVMVDFGEPEYGSVSVYVQFDHTCNGRPVPSNSKTYTYEIELDSFGSGADEEVADLQEEIAGMDSSARLEWIRNTLV